MTSQKQHARAAPTLIPMEQAPRDGTRFYALIDGLPYLAYYDALGRFIRVAHQNVEGTNRRWEVRQIDGKEWLHLQNPGEPARFEKHSIIWTKGFNHEPKGWIPCVHEVAGMAAEGTPGEQKAVSLPHLLKEDRALHAYLRKVNRLRKEGL